VHPDRGVFECVCCQTSAPRLSIDHLTLSRYGEKVAKQAQAEFCNWNHTGMGMHEMSHRDAGGPVQVVQCYCDTTVWLHRSVEKEPVLT